MWSPACQIFDEITNEKNKPGCFISIEGGEGSGKSTIIKGLSQYLASKGIASIATREPGGNQVCEAIRKTILENRAQPWTEALLFLAARKEHCDTIIAPALAQNKVVLCDRYLDSTLVYQAYVGNLDENKLLNLHRSMQVEMPNITILLDVDPKIGLERIFKNEREVNRIDLEGIDFHNKVRHGYLALARKYPERIIVLDASGNTEDTLKKAISIIERLLERSMQCHN